MDKEKYDEIDETFKTGKLMIIISMILLSFTLIILIALHLIIWKGDVPGIKSNKLWLLLIEFIIELTILSLLHEFIHAVTYIKLGKLSREAVKLELHLPKNIAIYYTEIVPINVRRWASIMPTLIICPLILIIGLVTNSLLQTIIAGFMFDGGISDMYNNFKLRKYKSDCMIEDKSNITGCIVHKPKE